MAFQILQSFGPMKWGTALYATYMLLYMVLKTLHNLEKWASSATGPTKLKSCHIKTLKCQVSSHLHTSAHTIFYAWNVPPTPTLGSCYNKNSLGYQTAKCVGRRWGKQKQNRTNINFLNITQKVSIQIWKYIYNGLYLWEKINFFHCLITQTVLVYTWVVYNCSFFFF